MIRQMSVSTMLSGLFLHAKRKENTSMISIKVIGIGAIISYGIAFLMKMTLLCIRGVKDGKAGERT